MAYREIACVTNRSSAAPAPSILVALALLLTIVVPPIALMKGAGSMALGVFAVSAGHIFLSLTTSWRGSPWPGAGRANIVLLIALTVVLVSGGASLIFYPEVDAGRLLSSLFFFLVYALGCLSFVRSAYLLPEDVFHRAVQIVFWALVLAGAFGILHISPFSSIHVKAVLFFTEPSHYALSFLPFLLYITLNSRPRQRILWICLGLAIALMIENLSLLVGVLMISLLVLNLRYIMLLSPAFLVAAVFVSLDYYADRLNFSEGSSNFSALVFVSGWERAYLAFRDTYGVGLGFQQFGVFGDQGTFSKIIVGLLGDRLNVLDGGTVGAKFIGEFGAIGLALLGIYLVAAGKIFIGLKRQIPEGRSKKGIFFVSCFLMFAIDIFVRGVAYFSPSGQLFLAAVMWLASHRSVMPSAMPGEFARARLHNDASPTPFR